jgi:hypothetical protein
MDPLLAQMTRRGGQKRECVDSLHSRIGRAREGEGQLTFTWWTVVNAGKKNDRNISHQNQDIRVGSNRDV